MKNKQIYIDISTNKVMTSEQGGVSMTKPSIIYGASPYIEFHLIQEGDVVDVSEATSWQVSIDTDFDLSTDPMIRAIDNDIDSTNATSGIIVAHLNTNTQKFYNVVNGKDSVVAQCEMRGFDGNGDTIYCVRFAMNCLGAIDMIALSSVPIPENIASKSYVTAVTSGFQRQVSTLQTNFDSVVDIVEDLSGTVEVISGMMNVVSGAVDAVSGVASLSSINDEILFLSGAISGNTEDISDILDELSSVNADIDSLSTSIASLSISSGGGASVDLSNYATKTYVDSAVATVSGNSSNLSAYTTKTYVDGAIATVQNSIPSLAGYATTSYVDSAVSSISGTSGSSTPTSSAIDYSTVRTISTNDELSALVAYCQEHPDERVIFTPNGDEVVSNASLYGIQQNFQYGHLYLATGFDLGMLAYSLEKIFPRPSTWHVTSYRKYYRIKSGTCTHGGETHTFTCNIYGCSETGFSNGWNGCTAGDALDGKVCTMDNGKRLTLSYIAGGNPEWTGSVDGYQEGYPGDGYVFQGFAENVVVNYENFYCAEYGYYTSTPAVYEECIIIFWIDITKGVLPEAPIILQSNYPTIEPGGLYSWTLSGNSSLSVDDGVSGKWATAEIDINPGAYTVSEGLNLTIVDSIAANTINHCIVKWRGVNARLYVEEAEGVQSSGSSSSSNESSSSAAQSSSSSSSAQPTGTAVTVNATIEGQTFEAFHASNPYASWGLYGDANEIENGAVGWTVDDGTTMNQEYTTVYLQPGTYTFKYYAPYIHEGAGGNAYITSLAGTGYTNSTNSYAVAPRTWSGNTPTSQTQYRSGTLVVGTDPITITVALGWSSCLVEGTMVTLADGSTKAVEEITYEDSLKVWDADNGCWTSSTPATIKNAVAMDCYYLNTFDDGSTLRTAGPVGKGHEVYDMDEQRFNYVSDCVGHRIFTEDGPKVLTSSETVFVNDGTVNVYHIITCQHFNLLADGVLTSVRLSNMYAYDENMKYIKTDVRSTDCSELPEWIATALRATEQPEANIRYIKGILPNCISGSQWE